MIWYLDLTEDSYQYNVSCSIRKWTLLLWLSIDSCPIYLLLTDVLSHRHSDSTQTSVYMSSSSLNALLYSS